jgi:peptidoglycan/xylan/chitin deacetylase (PgdA/CDA1 family)
VKLKALAILIGLSIALSVGAVASADTAAGTTVYRMPTSEKVVALTFDDRLKPAYARSIMTTLEKYGATCTFFVTGESLEAYPRLAQEIVARGHRIANHTYTHVYLPGKGRSYCLYQIRRFEQAARYARIPNPTPLFRAPGGSKGRTLLTALRIEGYANVLWSGSAGDTGHYATKYSVYYNVMKSLKPGAIILMHGSLKWSPAALPAIMAGIERRGYKVVDLYSYLYPHRAAAAYNATSTTTTTLPPIVEEPTTTTESTTTTSTSAVEPTTTETVQP